MAEAVIAKTSAEAKALGLKIYFTGKPCRGGHNEGRSVHNRTCIVCQEAKLGPARRKYREENREKCRAGNRDYASRNAPKILAKVRARQAGLKRATPWWVDRKEIGAVYGEAARLSKETGIKHSVDHVLPLKGRNFSGLHVPWNLAVLPLAENLAKGTRVPPTDELAAAISETRTYRWHQGCRCKRGHELTEDNVYISPTGKRSCRPCARLHSNAHARKTNFAAQKRWKAKKLQHLQARAA